MADDFNAPKKLANKERADAKIKEQEKPFSQRAKHTTTFNNPKGVYGEDIAIPERPAPPKREPAMQHDKPFKPSHPPRCGYNRTFNKYPEYKENPLKPTTRKAPVENEPAKFKPTYNDRSRPTPSVATNIRNLKASFPSAFRR